MFGSAFAFLPVGNSNPAGVSGRERERKPPPPATPVAFPHFVPPSTNIPSANATTNKIQFDEAEANHIFKLLTSIKRPTDITAEHIQALNVRLEEPVEVEDLIPTAEDGKSFLPPHEWEEEPPADGISATPAVPSAYIPVQSLSNGNTPPIHETYYTRMKELRYSNTEAFADIQRLPQEPGKPPRARPAHFRRFYTSLDMVAQYWDTSEDNLWSGSEEDGSGAENSDRDVPSDSRRGSGSSSDGRVGTGAEPMETDSPPRKRHKKSRYYKGRRTGTGKDMPDQFREDVVKAFVETIAWMFGCTVTLPRMPPRLSIQNALLPIRYNSLVYRLPTDRKAARAGNLEGPLTAIQCRSETSFVLENPAAATSPLVHNPAAMDLLRETGAILLLAQERAREGHEEQRPGEGKWWTTKPRWGGGEGGEGGWVEKGEGAVGGDEVANIAREGIVAAREGAIAPRGEEREGRRRRSSSRHGENGKSSDGRKKTAGEAWKVLRPGQGIWDRRIAYSRIGKPSTAGNDGQSWDNIFLISSINHHISILRARVHGAYLTFITSGAIPAKSESLPEGWDELHLQRSKWYDLLDQEDRVRAMRGVTGVVGYLMRGQSEGEMTWSAT